MAVTCTHSCTVCNHAHLAGNSTTHVYYDYTFHTCTLTSETIWHTNAAPDLYFTLWQTLAVTCTPSRTVCIIIALATAQHTFYYDYTFHTHTLTSETITHKCCPYCPGKGLPGRIHSKGTGMEEPAVVEGGSQAGTTLHLPPLTPRGSSIRGCQEEARTLLLHEPRDAGMAVSQRHRHAKWKVAWARNALAASCMNFL